jgi:hypothetical protein
MHEEMQNYVYMGRSRASKLSNSPVPSSATEAQNAPQMPRYPGLAASPAGPAQAWGRAPPAAAVAADPRALRHPRSSSARRTS